MAPRQKKIQVKRIQNRGNQLLSLKLCEKSQSTAQEQSVLIHKGFFSLARKNLTDSGMAELAQQNNLQVTYEKRGAAVHIEVNAISDADQAAKSICAMRIEDNICHVESTHNVNLKGVRNIATQICKRQQIINLSDLHNTKIVQNLNKTQNMPYWDLKQCVKIINDWNLQIPATSSWQKSVHFQKCVQAAKDIDLNFHTQDQVTDHDKSTIALNVGLAAFKDLFFFNTKLISRLVSANLAHSGTVNINTAREQLLNATVAFRVLDTNAKDGHVFLASTMEWLPVSDQVLTVLRSPLTNDRKPITRLSVRMTRGGDNLVLKTPIYTIQESELDTLSQHGLKQFDLVPTKSSKCKSAPIYVMYNQGHPIILNQIDVKTLLSSHQITPATNFCTLQSTNQDTLYARRRFLYAACQTHPQMHILLKPLSDACVCANDRQNLIKFDYASIPSLDFIQGFT